MAYKKINLEIVVFADAAEAIAAELVAALDRLEEQHTIFGGRIETVTVEHSPTRKRSAFMHAKSAGDTVVSAAKAAREGLTVALRAVI